MATPPPSPRRSSTPPELGLSSISVPDDVTLHIASFLEVSDVCSLGSCSRACRSLCASDCIWIVLAKKRWPQLALAAAETEAPTTSDHQTVAAAQGWKDFYIRKHEEMASCASFVVNFVEQCSQNGSLEVGNYLKAIDMLSSMKLGIKDIQLFLLSRKHGVLLNLIGLHYSLLVLGVPPDHMMIALQSSQVSELEVCVSWFTLGRWFYGFRLPDEHLSRKVSLGELVGPKREVLSVLNRGAVHEVIRVQITSITPSVAQGC